MKALFVSNDPNIFLAHSDVRARLHAYAALMEELHVISRAPQGAREERDGNLFLYPFAKGRLGSFSPMRKLARQLIRERGIEMVSAQDPFEYGYLARSAAQGTKAKLHLQVHTDFLSPFFARESLKNLVRVFIASHVIPNASRVRVVSKRIKDSIKSRYAAHTPEVSVIPVPVRMESGAKAIFPPHAFSFVLFAASRLEKEKRLTDVLKALAVVCKRYPHTGLFIAGAGREEARLRAEVRNLGLLGNVIFLGWRTDMRELMEGADAFVQASAYEGYGVSLVEAALAGTPIISTDVGIIGDVLIPGKDVLAVPPLAPTAFAAAIINLIEDESRRHILAENAQSAARTHITSLGNLPERIVKDLELAITRS